MGLYTLSQIQALMVDAPLMVSDPLTGKATLTIGVQRSTDLIQFNPFPMTDPQTSINASGKLEFQIIDPAGWVFFLLQAP